VNPAMPHKRFYPSRNITVLAELARRKLGVSKGKATSMISLKILQFDATDQKRVAFPHCNEVVIQNEMLPMNGSHEGE
jgi:hypothetical protein